MHTRRTEMITFQCLKHKKKEQEYLCYVSWFLNHGWHHLLLMFHYFLVARRFWGLTYSAGSALYQILQEMAFGTVHHMIFQSLHHQRQ